MKIKKLSSIAKQVANFFNSLLAKNTSEYQTTEEETRSIWMRTGIIVTCSVDEMKQLLENCDSELLKKLIAEGKWELDGETYVPWEVVDRYLEDYPQEIDRNVIDEPTFYL